MITIDKKNIIVIAVLIIIAAYLVYGWFVYDNGTGIENITNQLDRAREYNNQAIERSRYINAQLERSESGIIESQRRIDAGIGRLEEIKAGGLVIRKGLEELQRSNRKSQSIIERVRKRGQTQD